MAVTDYFQYQQQLAEHVLLPMFRECGLDLTGRSVLDIGCGQGGALCGLANAFALGSGLGIDTDAQAIATARRHAHSGLSFEVRDFFALPSAAYDLVMMRDVLEHIRDAAAAFARACAMVAPGGWLFISYCPYYAPFGGHQHNGSGFFARVPWLHLLPERWFRRLIRVQGNAYKQRAQLEADIESVLATRITARAFARLVDRSGLRVVADRKYAVRPDYRIKFGLPAVRLPRRYMPLLTELGCMGEEILLQRESPHA